MSGSEDGETRATSEVTSEPSRFDDNTEIMDGDESDQEAEPTRKSVLRQGFRFFKTSKRKNLNNEAEQDEEEGNAEFSIGIPRPEVEDSHDNSHRHSNRTERESLGGPRLIPFLPMTLLPNFHQTESYASNMTPDEEEEYISMIEENYFSQGAAEQRRELGPEHLAPEPKYKLPRDGEDKLFPVLTGFNGVDEQTYVRQMEAKAELLSRSREKVLAEAESKEKLKQQRLAVHRKRRKKNNLMILAVVAFILFLSVVGIFFAIVDIDKAQRAIKEENENLTDSPSLSPTTTTFANIPTILPTKQPSTVPLPPSTTDAPSSFSQIPTSMPTVPPSTVTPPPTATNDPETLAPTGTLPTPFPTGFPIFASPFPSVFPTTFSPTPATTASPTDSPLEFVERIAKTCSERPDSTGHVGMCIDEYHFAQCTPNGNVKFSNKSCTNGAKCLCEPFVRVEDLRPCNGDDTDIICEPNA